jgi:hypothetical protein
MAKELLVVKAESSGNIEMLMLFAGSSKQMKSQRHSLVKVRK